MTLAKHVRTLGRGPGRSRSLTREEAYEGMTFMLSGDAAPQAVGALLMLLRMKGETADEIAGLAQAAQETSATVIGADLDWPCYAAGRTRGQPWFLMSALLVAQAGHKVLLHGWNGPDPKIREGLQRLGIPIASNSSEATEILKDTGIAYLPLEASHPSLFALLQLRDVLGLRSCINTVCRMLNPGRATASVQGVFHPSYRLLQADAAGLLGWRALTVIKGGGGEFERNPAKPIEAFGLRDGASWQTTLPEIRDDSRRLGDISLTVDDLGALWLGHSNLPFEEAIALETTRLALDTLNASKDVAALWRDRRLA